MRPDDRRILQLVLATIWLLDGILQLQSFFFTKSFGLQMISGMSSGNPSVIARPISWSGSLIGHHAALTDAVFALIQCGLGFAIAWRPAVKAGLAASIAWSIGVWWIGEGLGGVLNGTANPVNGAPGAVILYALLAVLLWPSDRKAGSAAFIAARAVGEGIAKALWLMLWGFLAYFAVLGANRSPRDLYNWIASEATGEPGWIGWVDHRMANLVNHRGFGIAVALAILLSIVAISTYLPGWFANLFIIVALVASTALWVLGENFGALLTNGATDVNSGPLLALVAVAYWRASTTHSSIGTRGAPIRARARYCCAMTNPGWLNDLFAGLMLLVAAYSIGRLVAARAWSRPIHRDVDVAHVLMGTAMAGMLVSDLNLLPIGLWELVFSSLAGWFVWRCYQFLVNPGAESYYHEHVHRLSRRMIHLVMSLAMLYMYLAAVPSEPVTGGSMAMGAATGMTADFALLPAGFVLALLVSAIWQLDAIGRFVPSTSQLTREPAVDAVGVSSSRVVPAGAAPRGSPKSMDGTETTDIDVQVRRPPWIAPRLEAASHVAMCLTMAYMLILMV